MREHEDYIKETIKLAVENVESGKGGPFAAIVVKDGQIVGRGANCVTSSGDPTAHGEVMAIRDACKKLNNHQLTGCIIYSSCEPCPMCLGAIYWARPNLLVYAAENTDASKAGFDDSFIYRELALPTDERSLTTLHLKSDEYFSPFQTWIDSENKVEY